MKFPSKKDYKEINDFLDAVEEWCLDFHRRLKIEPLKEWHGNDKIEPREDKMLELSVAIDRSPNYHLIRLIREYRKAPSEKLAFEFIEYIDEAKESIARLEQQELLEEKTNKEYRLMYLITQQGYLYGKSNKEIANQIIKEELWFVKNDAGATIKDANNEPIIDNIDNLMKNIRKWKKDFPNPI